jgi:hypothetical protein
MAKRLIIPSATRRIGYAIAALVLVAVGAGLAGAVYLAQGLAESAPPDQRAPYSWLAWAALVGLGVVLILLASVLLRWLTVGLGQGRVIHDQNPGVDAWTLSGQRMQAEPEASDEDPGRGDVSDDRE